jgi:hypothetical protein
MIPIAKQLESMFGNNISQVTDGLKFQQSLNLPHFFFPHTTPQHFSTPTGYFERIDGDLTQRCRPYGLRNYSKISSILYEGDWRNEILHETLAPFVAKGLVTIVPISVGLNSQFDAHIGEQSGDCTHWCFPSSIYKYFNLFFYNAFRRRLELVEDITTTTAESQSLMQEDESKSNHVDNSDDMTWRLHPSLQNGDVACIKSKSGHLYCPTNNESHQELYQCYFIERGRFREIMDLNQLMHLAGITLCSNKIQQVKKSTTSNSPAVKFINTLEFGEFVTGSPMSGGATKTYNAKDAVENASKNTVVQSTFQPTKSTQLRMSPHKDQSKPQSLAPTRSHPIYTKKSQQSHASTSSSTADSSRYHKRDGGAYHSWRNNHP